jgi:pyruvate dehydrogenase (quinone)
VFNSQDLNEVTGNSAS